MAMTTAIASSSLVHLHPRLRRVEGRGPSDGNDKEEKEGGWSSHIVIFALLTLPPSEVESKTILMGHPISRCHAPVVRSFFFHCKMIISP